MKPRTSFLPAAAVLALLVGTSEPASALCGDVSGDAKVTSTDALRVLKKAVGQPVALTCEQVPVEFTNYFGFANGLTCNDASVKAQMTWSRHPGLTWSGNSQSSLPFTVDFERVDDSEVTGTITISFGVCGSIVFDINSWDVVYPMPTSGGAWVFPYYEASTNSVYLFLELAAVESPSLQYSDASPVVTTLAVTAAPMGLANAVEP